MTHKRTLDAAKRGAYLIKLRALADAHGVAALARALPYGEWSIRAILGTVSAGRTRHVGGKLATRIDAFDPASVGAHPKRLPPAARRRYLEKLQRLCKAYGIAEVARALPADSGRLCYIVNNKARTTGKKRPTTVLHVGQQLAARLDALDESKLRPRTLGRYSVALPEEAARGFRRALGRLVELFAGDVAKLARALDLGPKRVQELLDQKAQPGYVTGDRVQELLERHERGEALNRMGGAARAFTSALYPAKSLVRPTSRAECAPENVGALRPCPFVSCRHHLYLEVGDNGNIHRNHAGKQPWELVESCSLDVAARGPSGARAMGPILGMTRQGAQNCINDAVDSYREVAAIFGDDDDEEAIFSAAEREEVEARDHAAE